MINPPLDQNAFALRPVRILKNEIIRHYEAITFPKNPFNGCELYLRRCLGNLKDDGSNLLIDILDKNGDIIQDYPINKRGFEYLRRVLKFRIAKSSYDEILRETK